MHLCRCEYVCVYMSTRVHTRISTRVRAYVCAHASMCACMRVGVYVCAYVCLCVHKYVGADIPFRGEELVPPLRLMDTILHLFFQILVFAPRAPNLILAVGGAICRSADWPKSCTPRVQPINIESGAGGRVEVSAVAPVARVVQDFVHQPTKRQSFTCTGARK